VVELGFVPLRISAVFGGNGYFTAERAEIRRGTQRRKFGCGSAELRISEVFGGNGYFTAEPLRIRRGPQRRVETASLPSVSAVLKSASSFIHTAWYKHEGSA
jgi:hypothetical protein